MKSLRAFLIVLLLVTSVFTLAVLLQPRTSGWGRSSVSGGLMEMLLGDSRRLFANHFFVKADASFHSGYYPSIFDQAARQAEAKEAAVAHGGEHQSDGSAGGTNEEKEVDFFGPPLDWIDRFGRHFRITEHKHLEGANVREILPWLRISADLDPQRVETYTTAAYWLRRHMGKVDEAEQFLREGLRANPGSYEILFELGHLYYDDRHDPTRARNLWQLAVRRWHERNDKQEKPDFGTLHDLASDLGHLEEDQGNYARAIGWLTVAQPYSPHPDAVQARIDALRAKQNSAPKE